MNLSKRITACCIALSVGFGVMPQIVLATETSIHTLQDTPLHYEVEQEIDKNNNQSIISLTLAKAENVQLENVTLPDGTVQAENLSEITYVVPENGQYAFKVNYLIENTPQEEIIPVEVSELVEQSSEEDQTPNDILNVNGNTYEVSSVDQLKEALSQIGSSQDSEATILLTADISGAQFVGVANKAITVMSTEGEKYSLSLGNYLEGDITIDNVKVSSGELYCNGHKTIFTENCDFSIGSLFGGAYEQNVDSVYVKINGKGVINSGSSELVITGGCYSNHWWLLQRLSQWRSLYGN